MGRADKSIVQAIDILKTHNSYQQTKEIAFHASEITAQMIEHFLEKEAVSSLLQGGDDYPGLLTLISVEKKGWQTPEHKSKQIDVWMSKNKIDKYLNSAAQIRNITGKMDPFWKVRLVIEHLQNDLSQTISFRSAGNSKPSSFGLTRKKLKPDEKHIIFSSSEEMQASISGAAKTEYLSKAETKKYDEAKSVIPGMEPKRASKPEHMKIEQALQQEHVEGDPTKIFEIVYEFCKKGDIDLIKQWIKENSKRLEEQGLQKEMLFHAAAEGNQLAIFQWLSEQNPPI